MKINLYFFTLQICLVNKLHSNFYTYVLYHLIIDFYFPETL